ncbi:hypothetical protein [Pseudoduganella violacea]|uniref:Uncharacterized protein n=1 Tax=Pseudoduganella violacea TaxID=1715466 RepID=A0A7W5BE46_9BURK|nr:hypothetical protein [Pseudoduganella violacea]MBB3121166.1 hypothetical protein [Pseudoduganella violacea]
MNKLFAAVGVLTLAATGAQAGDPVRADAPVPATRYVPVLDAYRAEAPLGKTPAVAWAESNRIVAGQEGMAHGGHQMHGMHGAHQHSKPQETGKHEHSGHHGHSGHDMKEHKQ